MKKRFYVGYDGWNNRLKYRDFTVIDGEVPQVGELYGRDTVVDIEEVAKDYEQPNYDCWDYDLFKLICKSPDTEEDEEDILWNEYVCVKHQYEEEEEEE